MTISPGGLPTQDCHGAFFKFSYLLYLFYYLFDSIILLLLLFTVFTLIFLHRTCNFFHQQWPWLVSAQNYVCCLGMAWLSRRVTVTQWNVLPVWRMTLCRYQTRVLPVWRNDFVHVSDTCFTCVENDFVQVSDTLLVPLERLVVLLVEQHPQLHPKMHYVCYVAVVKVFVAVSHHGTAFPDFLSRTGQYHISLVLWHLVGRQEGHPTCKTLGVSLLVVTFWLELCTSYSSSCRHHFHHP